MFLTFDSGKRNNPFLGKGESMWEFVELALFAPFLFIKYSFESEDDVGFNKMIFLRTSDELLQLKLLENIELMEGYIVTPSYTNGTNEWKMARFTEVLEADLHSNEHQTVATRYLLSDGEQITINSSAFEITDDAEFKSVFRFN